LLGFIFCSVVLSASYVFGKIMSTVVARFYQSYKTFLSKDLPESFTERLASQVKILHPLEAFLLLPDILQLFCDKCQLLLLQPIRKT
jgi:hypothetical protein